MRFYFLGWLGFHRSWTCHYTVYSSTSRNSSTRMHPFAAVIALKHNSHQHTSRRDQRSGSRFLFYSGFSMRPLNLLLMRVPNLAVLPLPLLSSGAAFVPAKTTILSQPCEYCIKGKTKTENNKKYKQLCAWQGRFAKCRKTMWSRTGSFINFPVDVNWKSFKRAVARWMFRLIVAMAVFKRKYLGLKVKL